MRKFLLIFLIVIELLYLRAWFTCDRLSQFYLFSYSSSLLDMKGELGPDKNLPLWLIRIFHNKPIDISLDIARNYIQFWDIRFLISVLSIIGVVGFLYGFYYFFQSIKKNSFVLVLIVILILFPFIETFFDPRIDFRLKIALLAFPYELFSLFGFWKFMKLSHHQLFIIMTFVLIDISLWFLYITQGNVYALCLPYNRVL